MFKTLMLSTLDAAVDKISFTYLSELLLNYQSYNLFDDVTLKFNCNMKSLGRNEIIFLHWCIPIG